jgi:hypothetical protein
MKLDADQKRGKMFFFKKKNQKTFAPLRVRVPPAGGTSKNQSFFCFFFVHKKEDSSTLISSV